MATRSARSTKAPLTPTPFDAASYLEANAARAPDGIALWQDGVETSFAQLRDLVWRLIIELRRRELSDGKVVAVALPNVTAYVALEIAVPATGATLFPLPMGIGTRELHLVLQRSGAVLLITDESTQGDGVAQAAANLTAQLSVVRVDELLSAAGQGPAPQPPATAPADPDRIVQIALTSGTTGLPKLASLSARLKQLTSEGFTSRLRITAQDRMLPMSPITQGVGEMCLYAQRCGAALVMLGAGRFDPETVLATVQAGRVTILGGVPTMIGRILHSPAMAANALPDLRLTVSAGAPLAPALAREWEQRTGSAIGSFYGAMDIGQLAVPDPEDPAEKRWTTVGRPHTAAEWRICGPDGQELDVGEEGEICMRGPLVQDRYWGEDTSPYSRDGWAHFGDLGFVDSEGYVHVTGRVKDTIIRGGNNVNPLEVEELLREHAHIRDVCIAGRPDPDLGERAVAFVVAAPDAPLTLDDLTAFLRQRGLSRYKWPEALVAVDMLPTGATGKVDRSALRRQAAQQQPEEKSA